MYVNFRRAKVYVVAFAVGIVALQTAELGILSLVLWKVW